MKRLWIGVGFLIVMLVLGIWLTIFFSRIHDPLSGTLQQASALAMEGQWQEATELTEQARADWERYRRFSAAIADHEPLEEMDSLFSQLEGYAECRRTADFAALCARISSLAAAMAESQQLTWWNLL